MAENGKIPAWVAFGFSGCITVTGWFVSGLGPEWQVLGAMVGFAGIMLFGAAGLYYLGRPYLPLWLGGVDDPNDTIPIKQFLERVRGMGWELDVDDFVQFQRAMRSALVNGGLTFWGRPNVNIFHEAKLDEPLVPISADHWKVYDIDLFHTLNIEQDIQTKTHSKTHSQVGDDRNAYIDIHVPKSALGWARKETKKRA